MQWWEMWLGKVNAALMLRRGGEERWDTGNVERLPLSQEWKIEERKDLKVTVVITENRKDG